MTQDSIIKYERRDKNIASALDSDSRPELWEKKKVGKSCSARSATAILPTPAASVAGAMRIISGQAASCADLFRHTGI